MLGASALLTGSLSRAANASEGDDYRVDSAAWNGLSELVALARDSGASLRVATRVDLGTLRPNDGLLLIYPTTPPPRADLAAFMVEGGRLAIADDFGRAESILQGFGIRRSEAPEVPAADRLRANPNLLLARPAQRHPLAREVHALVANHAQILAHAELEPIFSLGDARRSAVVLAGAVGKGRLVALGDPSLLINNMLELRDHRTFARNLLGYLGQDGRVLLCAGDVQWIGRYPSLRTSDPLVGLREAMSRFADVNLPPLAVQLSTAVIALLLLGAAASALPRREHYLRAIALPLDRTFAGFSGRVRHHADARRDMAGPVLAYKQGFAQALLDALGHSGRIGTRDLRSALERTGGSPALVDETLRFVAELEDLELDLSRTEGRPGLGPRRLRALVERGDRILLALPGRSRSRG